MEEAGKQVAEGWNALLVAHLGAEGATLAWTVLWVAGGVLALVFGRYIGVLGAGGALQGTPERIAYDDLRASLCEGGNPTRAYGRLLTAFLDKIDVLMGDSDKAQLGLFRGAFWLRGSYPLWTGSALDRCLLLAMLYPFVTIVLVWAIAGDAGLAGEALGLTATVPIYVRVFQVLGLLFVAITCPLFVFKSSENDAIMLSGAFVVSSSLPFGVAFGFDFKTTLIRCLTLAVCLPVWIWIAGLADRAARRGWQGTFLVALGCTTVPLMVILPYWVSTSPPWFFSGPVLLFLGLLTWLNAPFDWFSIGLTRALLRRGVELQGLWPYFLAFVDAALALLIVVVLAGFMILGVQCFNLATVVGGGPPVVPLRRLLDGIAASPGHPRNWWVYGLLLSTLIPSVANLLIGCVSLTRGLPIYGLLVRMMPVNAAVLPWNRPIIAAALTAQWAIGVTLMLAAFYLLGYLASLLVPGVGTWFLDYARWIAALDLPRRGWELVGG